MVIDDDNYDASFDKLKEAVDTYFMEAEKVFPYEVLILDDISAGRVISGELFLGQNVIKWLESNIGKRNDCAWIWYGIEVHEEIEYSKFGFRNQSDATYFAMVWKGDI